MRQRLTSFLTADGLKARALRSSGMTIFMFGSDKFLRLVSNLILTRLLFPEVFGLMTLVYVFLSALEMFSDVGLRLSIIQNKRGDDPDFLNTVWTIQVLRGVFLWLGMCVLAWPVAEFYEQPILTALLPVVGLTAIVNGFQTTNLSTGNRHLKLGLQSIVNVVAQVITTAVTVALAYLYPSVWSLIAGSLIGSLIRLALVNNLLPGISNRFRWDPSAVREVVGFGKFIFIGSIAGFLVGHADKAIIGKLISLSDLGIYNVGYLLGALPIALAGAGTGKVVFPLYRMRPPSDSKKNRFHINKARRIIIGTCFGASILFAFAGVPLIEFLYDPRYALAGPMITLISLGLLPQLVLSGYPNALLAAGDSKRFFVYQITKAVIQTVLTLVLVYFYGIFGAIIAPGLTGVLTYPLLVRQISFYDANDRAGDIVFTILGLISGGLACWVWWADIALLLP